MYKKIQYKCSIECHILYTKYNFIKIYLYCIRTKWKNEHVKNQIKNYTEYLTSNKKFSYVNEALKILFCLQNQPYFFQNDLIALILNILTNSNKKLG